MRSRAFACLLMLVGAVAAARADLALPASARDVPPARLLFRASFDGALQPEVSAPGTAPEVEGGDLLCARVCLDLGLLKPEDVRVELCVGAVDANGQLKDIETFPMHAQRLGDTAEGSNRCLFMVDAIPCRRSGLFGYTIRILPQHPDLISPYLRGMVLWA